MRQPADLSNASVGRSIPTGGIRSVRFTTVPPQQRVLGINNIEIIQTRVADYFFCINRLSTNTVITILFRLSTRTVIHSDW